MKASLPILLLACTLLGGCTGTMLTRSSEPMPLAARGSYNTFGGYPFQAVVVDWRMEERSGGDGESVGVFASLAVDLVVDLVLSPIDLVAWAFGCEKRDMVR